MGLQGSHSLRKKVTRIKNNLEDEVDDGIREQSEVTARQAKKNVVEGNQVWTTNLYRSIGVERSATSDGFAYEVVADVPYAAMVEYGTGQRGDSDAPLKFQFDSPDENDFGDVFGNIFEWVKTKPAFFGPRTADVAAKITWTIIEEGTYAHPFFRPAYRKRRFVQEAEDRVQNVVKFS